MLQTAWSYLRALVFSPIYLWTELVEFLITVVRYYPNTQFRRADLRCFWAYFLRNPYRICSRYLRRFSDDEVQKIYGESFFTTLEAVAEALNLSEADVVYDLGCGRGRGVFWFNAFYKCRVIGVEINPFFVRNAQKIKEKLGVDDVTFVCANLIELNYEDATVIYLYGSAFEESAIKKIIDRFHDLAPGTRVVSVSYSLNEYTDVPLFELEQEFIAKYLWGWASIYIQRKLKP